MTFDDVRNTLTGRQGAPLSAKEIADELQGVASLDTVRAAVARGARTGKLIRHHNPDGIMRYTLAKPTSDRRASQTAGKISPSASIVERVEMAIVAGQYDTRDVARSVHADGFQCSLSEVAKALRELERAGVVEREVSGSSTLWRRFGSPASSIAASDRRTVSSPPPQSAPQTASTPPATAPEKKSCTATRVTMTADPFGLATRLHVVTEDAENLVHDALASRLPEAVLKRLTTAAFELGRAHRDLLSLSNSNTQGANQ
ncbi:MAG: hypothetical protein U0973_11615 [Xanthomonadaceae bacterium]|nr:hypothetical protein [Xanthomonadaceae bacterium]